MDDLHNRYSRLDLIWVKEVASRSKHNCALAAIQDWMFVRRSQLSTEIACRLSEIRVLGLPGGNRRPTQNHL